VLSGGRHAGQRLARPGHGHRQDRAGGRGDAHGAGQQRGVAAHRDGQFRSGLEDPQRRQRAASGGRRESGVVDERPGPVDQVMADFG
jgi:hypothetical protein